MTEFSWKDYEYTDFINHSIHEVNNLPSGVSVSTMCCSTKIGSEINITNIMNFLQLNEDDILTVKMNDSSIKTLLVKKIKKKKVGIKVQKCYNQITVVVRITDGETKDINNEECINVQLFKNGSIQMSGCKRIIDVNTVINKLIYRLKEIKEKRTPEGIEYINFLEDPTKVNVTNFKIDMINSNYSANLMINRSKFYKLLLKKKIEASFEPCIRACVIIKYLSPFDNPDEKTISIFVFQSGNIIITGAKSKNQVNSAYKYVNDIIIEHADEISKKTDQDEEETLLNFYKDIIEENKHKLSTFDLMLSK